MSSFIFGTDTNLGSGDRDAATLLASLHGRSASGAPPVELITVCRRIYVDALGGSRAARATWQAVDQRAGAPWGRRSASQGVAVPKVASMRRCERRQAPFSARVNPRALRVSGKPCCSWWPALVGVNPVAGPSLTSAPLGLAKAAVSCISLLPACVLLRPTSLSGSWRCLREL